MLEPESTNLEDNKIIVSCQFCKKKLLNIVIVAATPQQNKVECNCPFCGAKSPIVEIVGKLFWGPISKSDSNYPTTIKDVDNTDYQLENGKIVGNGTWLVTLAKS